MLIEHRPILTLYQKSLVFFSYILGANYSIYLKSDAKLQINPKNEK